MRWIRSEREKYVISNISSLLG
ncbi:hypothetical protein R3I94_018910 [Phoxinus phoxinus]